jgi:hypothetical protein
VYVFQAGTQEGSLELWLTPADFDGCPTWNSSVGEPPLSIRSAVDLSRSYCTKSYPDLTAFSVQNITLSRCSLTDEYKDNGMWTYHLSCVFIHSNKPIFITAIILMNGKVFEPELKPWNKDN